MLIILAKMNRNTAERERRSAMRNLLSTLFSLLPPQPIRMPIPDMLEVVRLYINQFRRHVEELRRRRVRLEEANQAPSETIISPVLNIIDLNSSMEVNLITGSNVTFTLSDIISILEEEGAQVLNAAYNNAGNMKIFSIHCQAVHPRIGIESSRLLQRLRTMIEE